MHYLHKLLVTLLCLPALSMSAQTARVQVIHNSPDALAAIVDVYLNDILLIDDFEFRTASPFIDAPAGVDFTVGIAPSNSSSSADAIATFDYNLAADETYIIVASGVVNTSGYDPVRPFNLEVFAGAREAASLSGNTDVLVYHGSTDAPAVDVVETLVTGGATIVDNAFYGDFAGYLELATLDYRLAVKDATGAVTVKSYEAPLEALGLQNAALTVLASGFLNPAQNSNGAPFGLFVALPSGGDLIALPESTARLQVIHNSADAAATEVDVYLNDDLLLDNFAFRTATPFIDAPAGVDIFVGIAPSTSTSSADIIVDFDYNLTPGESYIIVASGIVSGSGYNPAQPFNLEVFAGARESADVSGNTDVLVYHGSTDAPTVDVVETLVTGGATIVDNASYSDFAGYLELATLNYRLAVRDATGAITVKSYEAPLQALGLQNAALTVLASGFLDPSQNSNGAPFGLYVALPSGGDLIALPESTARLQVIHNSADAAAAEVDVYLNNGLLLDNFAFRTATPFIDAPAGSNISVGIAPSTSTSSADVIATFNYTLTPGESYIIVASGIVSGSGYNPPQPFNLDVFPGARESADLNGNTDVLVYHGSTDAPTVDVVETLVTGGATIVDNASYTNFAGYLELLNEDYRLEVRDETGTVTVKSYEAPLATLGLENAALAVLASGFLDPTQNSNGPAFGLYVALPSGGALIPLPESTARVQVIHNSADAAASVVDVYLNNALLIDDFAFRTSTPFVDVPSAVNITIGIAPGTSTSSADIIANFDYTLETGETYVIVASGLVSAGGYNPLQPFTLEVFGGARESASQAGNTDVLVFHGSTDAPTVDVVETRITNGLTVVDNASYTDFAGYLQLATVDYRLEVRDESGSITVKSYEAPLATLGLQNAALTVLASGFLNPAENSNGAPFGLYVALASGGALIPLPESTARVQVIHNSADAAASAVDVYLNNSLLIDDFAFRTATPFIDAPAGVNISVGIAPASSTSSADIIASFEYALEGGETYIIVASGIVSGSGYNPPQPFSLEVFAGAREDATSAGNTDVLVFHGSTDAPTVDVVETFVTGGATIVNDASYSDFAGYLELSTLNYKLDVRDETGTVTVKSYDAPLATLGLQNAALTVLASGFLNPAENSDGAAFGLYVALPSGGALIPLPESSTARVQVIHNSPDPAAAVVDVYLNDVLLLDNFSFRTATPFVDVPAATDITIGVAPPTSTSSNDVLASFDFNLESGSTYMIVADGLVVPIGFDPFVGFSLEVYPLAREQASVAGNTDVLVHHGSTDAPTVDVVETLVTDNATIVDDLAYGEFAGYLELATADYRIEVRDQTGVVTVASYDAPLATLGLNNAALAVIASGFLNPAANSNGAAFGLYVALPSGGALIPLPLTIPSATNDLERIQGNVYPNPATDFVTLEIPERIVTTYRIMDMAGKQMAVEAEIKDGNITFNTSTLNAGMYILEVSGEDFTSSAKISIKR